MDATKTTHASSTEARSIPDETRDFMAVLPGLVRNVIEHLEKHKCYDAAKWFEKVLRYNIPHGEMGYRGLRIVLAYKALVSKVHLTPENILLAQYLGWCVEMLQSFYLITDDIMDNSSTRRGQPCWHKVEDVGLIAINDAALIESAIYALLKQHFSHLDCYKDLLELFHEITFITNSGQAIDMLISRNTITEFNMEIYKSIAATKNAFLSCFPFALALHFAGIKQAEVVQQSKNILRDIGILYQMEDDFIDCFGDPEVSGKIGTDIECGKCTWLAAKCMQRANAAQKAIMVECYGNNDPAKVERVKELYKELDLPTIYYACKEESYKNIINQIEQIPDNVIRSIILDIFDSMYDKDAA